MEKKEIKKKSNLYPEITIKRITNPNRFYAVPILGIIVKIFMLIPQFFELIGLGIAAFFIVIVINPFVVLFSGEYWDIAYQLNAGILRLSAKIYLFIYGLTNTYPGFDFTIHDDYKVIIEKPQHPNRFFAIPLLGGIARIILLIPFVIYEGVIRYAAYLGAIGASFPVLFNGYYPESSYELARDAIRLNMSQSMYILGLSDRYPSFWISMNHKTIKWILIVLAILLSLGNIGNSIEKETNPNELRNYRNTYYRNGMMQNQDQMIPDYNNSGHNPSDLKTGY